MCGFLGIYAPPSSPLSEKEAENFRASSLLLAHRGNSSRGEEFGPESALFHYRLAFRDLTEGKQPLTDSRNRATILFNGELYGFRALREELSRNFDFRTRSDTEVILAAYLAYGEDFLQKLDGEYAFVIHDHRSKKIYAARDPFGVKPLFFSSGDESFSSALREYRPQYDFTANGRLHFASEIKGLGLPLAWDPRGLDRLFLSLYEEMGTSFRGVFQLPPGALFTATPEGSGFQVRIQRKIPKRRRRQASHQKSFEERAAELKEIISRTVESKLDSDVPLGAYLSGGIDSRIAAFEMAKAGARIETFTVGFEGADYDETGDVKKFLSAYPNLKGRALKTTNEVLEYSYPHAVYASELVQPYTNGAAKWWLSRFARRHVRGVLTGDGSDELFCGYPSYRYLAWWDFARRGGSDRASLFERRVVGERNKFWEKGLSSRPDGSDLFESVHALGWAHPLYAQIKSAGRLWAEDRFSEILKRERPGIYSYIQPDGEASSLTRWQNYFLYTHFPTHVLNWVGDRMEMANTLEGRPIFLSQSALDFLDASPDSHLVRGMRDKAVLRKAYQGSLGAFSAAPKKQFNAPFLIDGPLGKEFLAESALKASALIEPRLVARARRKLSDSDPLERSFAKAFLQNCLVAQMLDRYLVRGEAPTRDPAFEERYLDENTVNL
jgi:asparagine synthase (glutamine-hydrolysing)